MSEESFTIPASDLRRAFRWYWLAAAAGVVLPQVIRPAPSFLLLLGSAALVFGILYLRYRITLRRAWVALSVEGFSGAGETKRDLRFTWADAVAVEDGSKYGLKGVLVYNADHGMPRRRVAALFIPEPVLRLDAFHAALGRVAPASHPLRTKAESAR